jgi:hypothetical protein
MKRTALRKVSKKRAKQCRKYPDIRREYLRENPYCQVCQKELRIFMQDFNNGEIYEGPIISETEQVRKATQIHHVRKRFGERLNDNKWFLAVCSKCHTHIEHHLSWARNEKRLYVQDHLPLPII